MTISPTDVAIISKLLAQEAGMSLESSKPYLVESRLTELGNRLAIGNADAVIGALRKGSDPMLAAAIVEVMTTNETSFFRDPHVFEAFAKVVLPDCLEAHANNRQLSVWSAASSSGQEAYTLAMILSDNLPSSPAWKVRILATDISKEMVERTRHGLYSQLEVNRGLPAPMLLRHFQRKVRDWQAGDHLRSMVEARLLNLSKHWPAMPQLDVVFLRNVLIYFDPETRRKVLAGVARLLRPGGALFMGTAESPLQLSDAFERVVVGRATYYRRLGTPQTGQSSGLSTGTAAFAAARRPPTAVAPVRAGADRFTRTRADAGGQARTGRDSPHGSPRPLPRTQAAPMTPAPSSQSAPRTQAAPRTAAPSSQSAPRTQSAPVPRTPVTPVPRTPLPATAPPPRSGAPTSRTDGSSSVKDSSLLQRTGR